MLEMELPQPLLRGRLLQRYKRFLADIRLDSGEMVTAHCPNSGSMLGCKEPGSEVLLSRAENSKRKLRFTWELVRVGETWVGINTMRTNRVVEHALRQRQIVSLREFETLQREVPYGENSRVDFLMTTAAGDIFIEVKNVTLAEDGLALFPDAVTARGTKHLRELMRVVKSGKRGVMFFLVNRSDTTAFRPAAHIDPVYSENLAAAVAAGVEVLVYDVEINRERIDVRNSLPWNV